MAEVAAAQAMIQGGQSLQETIDKLITRVVSPSLQQLDKEIKKIDTTIDGLSAEEKKLVTEATRHLFDSRSSMYRVKLALNSLAQETITVAEKLKRYVKKCKDIEDENRIKNIIGKAAEQMIHILKRSNVILEEAKTEYKQCDAAMNSSKANLETFVKSVKALREGQDGRLDDKKKKLRAIVYGATSLTILGGPIALGYGYGVAAGVLEAKIKEYEDSLDRLLRKCDKSTAAAVKLIKDTNNTKDFIEGEQKLIQNWESALSAMNVDFKDADTIAKNISIFEGEETNRMLDDLITACAKYKGHVMSALHL